jgi:bleomycin hydrolase
MKTLKIIIGLMLVNSFVLVYAQDKPEMKILKQVPTTSIKNQYKSNTCWSFSVLAMLESELLKNGKGEFDLSEMYVVHQVYLEKALSYARMHGHINFAGGGSLNDPIDVIRKYGIVPEQVYSGLKEGCINHDHIQMDAALKDYMEGVIRNKTLSPVWLQGFEGVLDAYLGNVPEMFVYNGTDYTPKTFATWLGINPDDYVLLTSFTHHPYYQKFKVEVPDNWSWGEAYNVTLSDLENTIDYSVNKNYTLAWAADITEKGFQWGEGITFVDSTYIAENTDNASHPSIWVPQKDKKESKNTVDELTITPELRQKAFDNYSTTDDHGMQIIGIANDQNKKKYYIVKNSWGTDGSPYKGFIYVSKSYILYKTLTVLVNKKGIPESILKKLK